MEKLFYTISEVAESLGESIVTVRYWSNSFSRYISPRRNGKGNRLYRKTDIDTLIRIRYLTRDCGLSLAAVSKKLSKNRSGEDKTLEIRDSLLKIRSSLEQIKSSL